MDFSDQIRRYFGQDELSQVPPAALDAGIEKMLVDLGLEKDAGRRFGLWALLYMLDAAPDLDTVFAAAGERDAARNFMDMVDRLSDE